MLSWLVATLHLLALGVGLGAARIGTVQAALVVAMVFAATAMARGIGA